MFENVTYTYYTETLLRAAVPDEDTFNDLAFGEKVFIESIRDRITEREEGNLDKAVCMMIEEDYLDSKSGAGGRVETSRSLDGFSQSFDISKSKTKDEKRLNWLKMYCYLDIGVA